MKKIFLIIAIHIVACISLISPKNSNANDNVKLDKIVVTPSRIEQRYNEFGRKVDIISAKDFKYLNPRNVSDLLDNFSSVNISDYGSLGAQKTIYMRGSTPSQVLVLVDGRPINNPRAAEVNLSTEPLYNIERIEVLHGPASSIYGSSAMGGVVNIITKDPTRRENETEFTSSFGTFRTYQEQLSHSARIKDFAYRLTTSYQSSEGHRDNSEFNAKDVNSKLIYEFNSQNKLTLNGGFYKDKLGTPGSILSPDLNDIQLDRKNYFALNWKFNSLQDEKIDISSRIYQNYDRLEFIETPEPLDKTTHTTKARGLNLNYSQNFLEKHRLTCGLDWAANLNESTKTAKHEYIVRAGYIESQIGLLEKLNVNFGARFDDYSNFGTEVSPNLNIFYNLKNDTKLNLLVARSFRAPTFNDLYWPSGGGLEGNPSLGPEKGITGEFGIEKIFPKFTFGLTYFRSDYDKLIKWQEDDDGVFRPRNIDSAAINGVEEEIQIKPFDNLNINIGYTYLRAKNKKLDKYLTDQPKHKGSLSLIYKKLFGFNAGLEGQFVDRRFDNASNTRSAKRFYVLGMNLSKDVNKNSSIFFNIYNLLNKKYQYRRNYPQPGFSITSGLKIKF